MCRSTPFPAPGGDLSLPKAQWKEKNASPRDVDADGDDDCDGVGDRTVLCFIITISLFAHYVTEYQAEDTVNFCRVYNWGLLREAIDKEYAERNVSFRTQ